MTIEEWTIVIDGEEWTIRAEGKVAERLGPTKRDWVETEVRRHYSAASVGPHPLTFAGTRYRGASGEYEVAIDFDHQDHEITISAAS